MRTVLILVAAGALARGASAQPARLIGWGEPRDGFIARLVIEGGEKSDALLDSVPQSRALIPRPERHLFVAGDVIRVRLVLKNAGDAQRPLKLRAMRDWSVGISTGMLTLEPMPGEPMELTLAPGEERWFDGPAMTIATVNGMASPTTLPILPGRYTVRTPMPFWVPDADDANRSTALRAAPGTAEIGILPGARSPRITPAAPERATFWGDPSDGIQLGFRYSNGKHDFRIGEVVTGEVVIRNALDLAMSVATPEFRADDNPPHVVDAKGHGVQVDWVWLSGLRALRSVDLKPGEERVLGRGELHIAAPSDESARSSFSPTLGAAPGEYQLQYFLAVKPAGSADSRVHVYLQTGRMPFRVVQ